MVDEAFDEKNIKLGKISKVKSFGKEKANDVVGVLVGSTLPGFMRLCEVHEGVKVLFQGPELRELRTVVETNTLYRQILHHLLNCATGLFGRPGGKKSQPEIAAPAIHKRNERPLTDSPAHRVTFPIADPFSALNYLGPLGNYAVGLNGIIVGISGLNTLSTASKVLFLCDFWESSFLDVAIDGRCTERFSVGVFQMPAPADRLRGPKELQLFYDIVPFGSAGAQSLSDLFPATTGIAIVSTPVIVAILVVGFFVGGELGVVAFDLAADGGRTTFEKFCNFSKRIALCQKLL